jgi:hypothetical protein
MAQVKRTEQAGQSKRTLCLAGSLYIHLTGRRDGFRRGFLIEFRTAEGHFDMMMIMVLQRFEWRKGCVSTSDPTFRRLDLAGAPTDWPWTAVAATSTASNTATKRRCVDEHTRLLGVPMAGSLTPMIYCLVFSSSACSSHPGSHASSYA